MNIEFSAEEARVIGCLIEKQITTPDQYPLSLNALTNACNQKSNRDPLMALDEPSVQHIVDTLARRHFILEKSGLGSRVPKFQHRFCNSEYGTLRFSAQELVDLYGRGTAWCLQAAMKVAPEDPWAWDSAIVVDAAFGRYLREAADYAGGRREINA